MTTRDTINQRVKGRRRTILSLIGFGAIALLMLGLLMVSRFAVEAPQDIRQQASVKKGLVTVEADAYPNQVDRNEDQTITLQVNTGGAQIDGVQLVFDVITDVTEEILIEPANGKLRFVRQEVEAVDHGYKVEVIAITKQPNTPFNTATNLDLLEITFNLADRDGQVKINFDTERSIATIHGTAPPSDELTHIEQIVFDVGAGIVDTDDDDGEPESNTCNESCSSNSDCSLNERCYNTGSQKVCRRATNVDSTSCSNPPDRGLSFQCNEYCADTNQCADGYTCWFNRCRDPQNVESTSCQQLSVGGQQQIAVGCNQSCSSNNDCGVNMRCFNNSCRLATNPSSTSCTAATQQTVTTNQYRTNTQKGTTVATPRPAASTQPTATASPTPSPTATPLPTPLPTRVPTPTPEPEESLLDNFFQLILNSFLNKRGSSGNLVQDYLPFIIIGAGVILLIVAGVVIFGQGKGKPPIGDGGSGGSNSWKNRPDLTSPLKPAPKNNTAASVPDVSELSTKPFTPPPTHMPGHGMNQATGVGQNTISNPQVIEGVETSVKPPQSTQPGQITPQAANTTMGSTMVDRLKEKGINPPGEGGMGNASAPPSTDTSQSTQQNAGGWPKDRSVS